MTADLYELLSTLHASIDHLATDLARDRPDLASAVRRQAEAIPRPDELGLGVRRPTPPRAALRPLLYDALDAGLIDARRFDRLMLLRVRSRRVFAARRAAAK